MKSLVLKVSLVACAGILCACTTTEPAMDTQEPALNHLPKLPTYGPHRF